MAANKDMVLIAKIVDTGDIRTAYDAGIRSENFAEVDAKMLWSYIYEYWRGKATSGDVPTRECYTMHIPLWTYRQRLGLESSQP